MSSTALDPTELVSLSATDNTFEIPAVETTKITSSDRKTVHVGHKATPDHVFERDTLLTEFTITSLDAIETNIAGAYDPFFEYLDNPLIKAYLAPFGQVNFGLILTVRLIVPGSCYGLYNVQLLCDGGRDFYTGTEMDSTVEDAYPQSTQDVHTFLNVDIKNSAVFELPWEHFNDSYNLANLPAGPINGPGCWRLLIFGLSRLQNTLSNEPLSGRIQVYGRMMPGYSFENLTYQSGRSVEKFSTSTSLLSKGFSSLTSSMPAVAPMSVPISKGLAALSSVADMFGYTRDAAPQMPLPVVRRMINNMGPIDSEDSGEVVALSVANAVTVDPSIGGGELADPTDIGSLLARWTIIDTFSLNETSTGNVYSIPVSPYYCNKVGTVVYPTTAGWVGTPFAAWRGSMEYAIYIPSSANIQGSLQVIWEPSVNSGAPFVLDPTNTFSNVIIDMKGSSETVVRVDYSQVRPAARSIFTAPGSVTTDERGFNGRLIFKINAPLTAPRVTGFSVEVIVMARAASNMEFGIPTARVRLNNPTGVVSGAYTHDIRYQAGPEDVCVHPASSSSSITLNSASEYPTSLVLFGEQFKSVKAYMQKLSPVARFGLNELTDVAGWPHFMPPPTNSGPANWSLLGLAPGDPTWTYFGWYTAAFAGLRGSSRIKVTCSNTTQFDAFSMPPGLGVFDPNSRTFPGLQVLDRQTVGNGFGAEFQYPYYAMKKYILVREIPDAIEIFTSDYRFDYLSEVDGGTTPLPTLFYGAGPDISVTRFRRVPGLTMPAI